MSNNSKKKGLVTEVYNLLLCLDEETLIILIDLILSIKKGKEG